MNNPASKPTWAWTWEFQSIEKHLTKADSAGERLHKWVWNNVVPDDILPRRMPAEVLAALNELKESLDEIKYINDKLKEKLVTGPGLKALSGARLTKEEFYILASLDCMDVPSAVDNKSAFECHDLFYYADDVRQGYIDSTKQSPSPPTINKDGSITGTINLRYGVLPEDVQTSYLRPDQETFFKKELPELYSRFKES